MFKVLIADAIDLDGLEPLASDHAFQLVFLKDSANIQNEIPDADALLVRSKTKVRADLLDLGKKLKFVGRAGVGVDNIDVAFASKKGIMVVNVPGGNTISASEHTFALILTLARNIPQSDASVRKKLWNREKFIGAELHGKVLGLLGFGRIGKEVAKRAIAFGMKVLAYDPFVSETHMKSFGVHSDSFENILKNSDYLSLHLPLTDQTKKIINEQTLAQMKPDCRLINCARGELIDEPALIRALQSKQIKGAALDVFSLEPPQLPELFQLENVILTPHLGASTEEAQIKVARELAFSLKDFFEKGIVRNAVNLPAVDSETLEKSAPYLTLAEKLGRFISQIVSGGIEGIKIEISGDFSSAVRNLLALSAIKGALATALGATEINWVNAIPIAKERGIKVEESALSDAEDFTTLITVKIKTDQQVKSVSGTLLSLRNPRIVRIDDLSVDVIPEGHLLVLTNIDQPGVIGFIGTVLGESQINIAEFQVGRKRAGGEAVSILNVDSPVPKEVLKKISGFRGITNVWVVNLANDSSF